MPPPEGLLDRVTRLPLAYRLGIALGAVALITGGTYFAAVSGQMDDYQKRKQTLAGLEQQYAQKIIIANNLNTYREQKQLLERRLAQALTELPNDANIDDLIKSVNDVATKSGLVIRDFLPGAEKSKGFYAAIPISMTVEGNYNEIAVFFDSVGKLPRIVNINDISLTNPRVQNEKVVLTAKFVATTFRFIEQKQPGRKATARR